MNKSFLIFFALFGIGILDAERFCNCKISTNKKIVNEKETRGSVPWLVAVNHNFYGIICTGVLVSETKVLTASNCLHRLRYVDLTILGAHNSASNITWEKYAVQEVVRMEKFNPYQIEKGNDLAIIELKRPVNIVNGKREIACLDFEFERGELNETLLATDFDYDEKKNLKYSNVTRSLDFKMRNDEISNLIAAQSAKKGQFMCNIIGMPIHRTTKTGVSKVVGITSYVESDHDEEGNVRYCTEKVYFTKLRSYNQWLKDKLVQYC